MKKINSKFLWLFISNDTLTAARFKGSNGNTKTIFINAVRLAPGVVNEGKVVNPQGLKEGLESLLTDQNTKRVETILLFSEKQIFHHRIELTEEKKIDLDQIQVMAQELFPIDLNTTCNDAFVEKKYVEFVAISKSILNAYLEAASEIGLNVVKVDMAREFIKTKSSPINLLPPELKEIQKQTKTVPKVAFFIIIIFGYLTHNLLTGATRWANDYSSYISSQKNLLAIQNIVDTVYSKDIALAHFEKFQLNSQIEAVIKNRLASAPFIEAIEEIGDKFVSLREVKALHQTEGELPTVRISALSSSRDKTEAFSDALKESPLFDEVDLPLSFFSKRGEAIIEITLELNEEAYKKLKSEPIRRKPKVPKRPNKQYFN